jgi:hypothetical protein
MCLGLAEPQRPRVCCADLIERHIVLQETEDHTRRTATWLSTCCGSISALVCLSGVGCVVFTDGLREMVEVDVIEAEQVRTTKTPEGRHRDRR